MSLPEALSPADVERLDAAIAGLKSLFGNSRMGISTGEIGAHGDEDHGL